MDPLTKPEWRAGVRRVLADDIGMMMGTGGPSGITAPVGSTWRQTDANASHGNLTGLLWNKVGTGTTEGTDWLVDYEGRWVSYTPTITTASNPQPSGWTQGGYYCRAGKLITARFNVVAPSSNFGTGQYSIALPVQASANYTTYSPVGNVYAVDASAGSYLCVARIGASATTLQIVYFASSPTYGSIGGWFGATGGPFTVAQSDSFTGQVTYEIA